MCNNTQFLLEHSSEIELEGREYVHLKQKLTNTTSVVKSGSFLVKIGTFFKGVVGNQKSLMMMIIIVVAVSLCFTVICCMCCCRKKGQYVDEVEDMEAND
jgi:hypothetical protein